MRIVSGLLVAAIALLPAYTGAAYATNGRQAVGMCTDQPDCSWSRLKDGSIFITKGDKVITCPSAEAQCTVELTHGNTHGFGPRPTPPTTIAQPGKPTAPPKLINPGITVMHPTMPKIGGLR
jgi:hypothetical protein